MTDIHIARRGFDGGDTVEADVDGDFAIHESVPATLETWTLTHVPTGYAVLMAPTRVQCVGMRAELLAGGLDWSFTDPRAVTDEHKRVGKALQGKYGDVR